MRSVARLGLATVVVALLYQPAGAQNTPPATSTASAPNKVAATVNGQPIMETAVQRGLVGVRAEQQAEARQELLGYLIDNCLIEQYLLQLKVAVEKKEIDDRIEEYRTAIKKAGKTFEEVMKKLNLTEEELRAQSTADIRWDKFVNSQATDKALRELFDNDRAYFDGSMVRARHILLSPPANDAKAGEEARAKLLQMKKQIEDQVAAGLAKLPANTDNLAREQARTRLIDDAFAAMAKKESACEGSKENGGDLGPEFPRAAHMVEPFAKAAFALKPYQMSDVVKTQFGYHLILLTNRKPGRETKFEDVKEEVKEVYAARLREELAAKLRQTAKIEVK